MKITSVLLKLKPWTALHPPLPRTPRESEMLLNALTSSFRRQLDREYPAPDATSDPVQNPNSSVFAADQHLKFVLDSPLFQSAPLSCLADARKASDLTHQDLQTAVHRRLRRRCKEQPMAVIDEMISSGSVQLAVLRECLANQLILSDALKNPRRGKLRLRDSQAGSKVVNWFWTAGPAERMMLLKSATTIPPLLPFLVCEGMQDTILRWLRMVLDDNHPDAGSAWTAEDKIRSFRLIFHQFMVAETRYGRGMNSALEYFLQVCRFPAFLNSTPSLETSVLRAAHDLLGWIRDPASGGHDESISLPLYDEFRDTLCTLGPGSITAAAVAVHHPAGPDPKPLLHLLARSSFGANAQRLSESNRRYLFKLCCEAILALIDHWRFQEASRLTQSVQHFLRSRPAEFALQHDHLTT